jgi:hypothetical protein
MVRVRVPEEPPAASVTAARSAATFILPYAVPPWFPMRCALVRGSKVPRPFMMPVVARMSLAWSFWYRVRAASVAGPKYRVSSP